MRSSHDVLPERPALRDSVLAFHLDDGRLQFVLTSSTTVKTFEADEVARRAVALLDGTQTVAQLRERLRDTPGYSPDALDGVLETLQGEALLARPQQQRSDLLTDDELERYDRQLQLFAELALDLGIDAHPLDWQERLRAARVTVVGTGGLGSWVLAGLAALGVGRLRLCDFDRVEPSNLNRQILYGPADLGRRKIDAAAARLQAFNPHVTVDPVELRLAEDTPLHDVVADCDVVVNCADRPNVTATSDWVAAACVDARTAHVVGGAYAGQLGVLGTTVLPGRSTCWACVRAETRADLGRDRSVPLKGATGPGASLGLFSGIVGNLLGWEVARVVLGLSPLLADRVGEVDLWTLQPRWRAVAPRPGCPTCSPLLRR